MGCICERACSLAQFPKNVLTILTILTKRRNPHFLSLQYKATFPYNVRFSLQRGGAYALVSPLTVIATPNLVTGIRVILTLHLLPYALVRLVTIITTPNWVRPFHLGATRRAHAQKSPAG